MSSDLHPNFHYDAQEPEVIKLRRALKQAREERDAFAASSEIARMTVEAYSGIPDRHGLLSADDLPRITVDPAECLKARDAEIRYRVIREIGRNGGIKGAATLNAKLTPEERKASASKAAKSRWTDSAGGKR